MGKLRKVLIMSGGTGGHVFPGLAIARRLREEGVEVNWLGTRKGLESKLVPDAGIPLHYITISGIRGKGWKDLLLAPFRLLLAILQSLRIIFRLKPDVVIGMGGFVSGPGGIATWLLRRPLVVHEQNAKPGTTNKYLSRVAKKVLEAFPDTFSKNDKVITVGNPVRAEIMNIQSPEERFRQRHPRLYLLVLGGSMGAAAINQLVPKALALIPEEKRPLVIHQAGEKHYEETLKAYENAGVSAEITPFIVEMDKAYQWADIVLCRSGALTVTELCTAGVGAILVPFPFAVDDHQTANANFMAKIHAAWLIQQKDLSVQGLASVLKQLTNNREKCFSMAQSAYESRKIDATEQVLRICEEVCN